MAKLETLNKVHAFLREREAAGVRGIVPAALADRLHTDIEDATAYLIYFQAEENILGVMGRVDCPECEEGIPLQGRTAPEIYAAAMSIAGTPCPCCEQELPLAEDLRVVLTFFFRRARPNPGEYTPTRDGVTGCPESRSSWPRD
jgi:hypothetical protein